MSAIRDQLGLSVLDVKPVGLEASGGSTPLRIKIDATEDEPERYVFAKLYAKSHVRADRWYKLGRTILYGALEDEKPFQSVRRFVEYEDYTLRLLHELGVPVPRAYGIVEITPEREYMIVMEFFEGAVEIGDADIDDGVIDQGLALVRKMWDEGLAHRDVKPANLMVRDGELKVIDVFFVQVRPSPWRQAVDLANMMLVLALRSDAERVYAHALHLLHRGRDRRGVRRRARRREPDPAPQRPQAGRPRPPGRVPTAGPRARTGLDPALEPPQGAPHGRGRVRRLPSGRARREQLERVRMRWREIRTVPTPLGRPRPDCGHRCIWRGGRPSARLRS